MNILLIFLYDFPEESMRTKETDLVRRVYTVANKRKSFRNKFTLYEALQRV